MTATVEKGAADSSVSDIAVSLENVDVNAQAAENQAAVDAASASAAEGRRLYIGNLAYASTEEDLKEFFKEYLVETVSIPKNPRTDKAVGYAFVDLSTPTEAERAISELSGKDILERKVSVQIAHKPDAHGERAEDGEGEGGRRRGSGRNRARPRFGRGNRNGRTGAPKDGESPPGDSQPRADVTDKNDPNDDKSPKSQKAPGSRGPRERGPPSDGVASKTKVMVANLPYDLTEEKLKELFASYEPSSAKIALRPIPRFMIKKLQARNEPRKGRGFGFVTLASEDMQQKAVAEMNGKEIEGREIAVKIAIDSPDKTDDAPKYEAKAEGAQGASEIPVAEASAVTA